MSEEFPGYFGFTSRGVIAIHANWPAYPREHGWQQALITFGNFPIGTTFRCEDNIDKCSLFEVLQFPDGTKVSKMAKFYVAVWQEDLIELDEMNFLNGIEYLTDDDVDERKRQKIRMQFGDEIADLLAAGAVLHAEFGERTIPIDVDSLIDPDDDDYAEDHFGIARNRNTVDNLYLPRGTVVHLSRSAEMQLQTLARSQLKIPSSMQGRILPQLSVGLFDTAIRELGVALESEMRRITGNQNYGYRLVKEYIARLQSSGIFIGSSLKVLDTELRAAMKFVRNEYAHELSAIEPTQGYALVSRMCDLLSNLESATRALDGGSAT